MLLYTLRHRDQWAWPVSPMVSAVLDAITTSNVAVSARGPVGAGVNFL
jgi:hypothetical protein